MKKTHPAIHNDERPWLNISLRSTDEGQNRTRRDDIGGLKKHNFHISP